MLNLWNPYIALYPWTSDLSQHTSSLSPLPLTSPSIHKDTKNRQVTSLAAKFLYSIQHTANGAQSA